MLNVNISKDGIVMKGHADFAKRGQDIVCASASAVFLFTSELIEEYAMIEGVVEPGDATLLLCETNNDTYRILHTFEQFMRQLEKQYPKHIKVFGGVKKLQLCNNCGKEERNPGLGVCGPCYDKQIRGSD